MATTSALVLDKFWDGRLPVDPSAIAEAMGVGVHGRFGLPEGSSGMIQLEGGEPVIYYNQWEARVRQRFTLAHELGHFACGHLTSGKTLFRDTPDNFSAKSYSPVEREANAFAAELLMPENTVRYAVLVKQIRDIAELADRFHVSQVAMRYRLMNLGLLRD